MSSPVAIESLRFETGELEYSEAGTDFRAGTHLYDSAMVGRIHLYVNGEEVVEENRLPSDFDVSDTVRAMFEMIYDFETTGSVRTTPFCCICGDRGCAYIRWKLESGDSAITLITEDLMGEPIGAHQYQISLARLSDAVAQLADSVVSAMKEANVRNTTAGTVDEFVERRDHLKQYTER